MASFSPRWRRWSRTLLLGFLSGGELADENLSVFGEGAGGGVSGRRGGPRELQAGPYRRAGGSASAPAGGAWPPTRARGASRAGPRAAGGPPPTPVPRGRLTSGRSRS